MVRIQFYAKISCFSVVTPCFHAATSKMLLFIFQYFLLNSDGKCFPGFFVATPWWSTKILPKCYPCTFLSYIARINFLWYNVCRIRFFWPHTPCSSVDDDKHVRDWAGCKQKSTDRRYESHRNDVLCACTCTCFLLFCCKTVDAKW